MGTEAVLMADIQKVVLAYSGGLPTKVQAIVNKEKEGK